MLKVCRHRSAPGAPSVPMFSFISLQRLKRELDVWQKLDHTNVMPLLGTSNFEQRSLPATVCEWCCRGNLSLYARDVLIKEHSEPKLTEEKVKLVCLASVSTSSALTTTASSGALRCRILCGEHYRCSQP